MNNNWTKNSKPANIKWVVFYMDSSYVVQNGTLKRTDEQMVAKMISKRKKDFSVKHSGGWGYFWSFHTGMLRPDS